MTRPLRAPLIGLSLILSTPGPGLHAQENLTRYELVVLRKGPAAASLTQPAGHEVLKAHVAHLYKLGADGRAVAAGPFTDGGDIQGIVMMRVGGIDKALEIQGADPAVESRIFTMEALPFLSPPNHFGRWAEFGKFETVYFGFLVRGPNRGQDAETAKQLQAEHLAYMESQAKLGRLIVAGPLAVDEARRGIVVYRAASLEQAREYANGDPMIKVGRLVVDLHPWQVPLGALPAARN